MGVANLARAFTSPSGEDWSQQLNLPQEKMFGVPPWLRDLAYVAHKWQMFRLLSWAISVLSDYFPRWESDLHGLMDEAKLASANTLDSPIAYRHTRAADGYPIAGMIPHFACLVPRLFLDRGDGVLDPAAARALAQFVVGMDKPDHHKYYNTQTLSR